MYTGEWHLCHWIFVSKKEKKVKQPRAKRMPTILEALLPVVAMLLVLFIGKGVLGFSTEPLLIIVACVAAFVADRKSVV